MAIPAEEVPWAQSLAHLLRERLLALLTTTRAAAIFAVHWFFTVTIPLYILVGIPSLVWAGIKLPKLLVWWIDFCEVLGQCLASLETFMGLLPRLLYEILFTERYVDSPFLLWLWRVWWGFFRGLGGFFGVRGVEVRVNGRVVGAGEGGGDDERRGLDAKGVADANGNGDEPVQEDPSPQERAGQSPHTIAQELQFWASYYKRTAVVVVVAGALLALVYFFCNFIVSVDSWCGTSVLCGGPNGPGEYECLMYNDAVIRQAMMGAHKAPLKYRFFYDGTRMQFPDA